MTRLAKYLKPFLWMVVISVALLFVQAISDLALPDYMSKIVNIGIQQGGVQSSVPEILSGETYSNMKLFLKSGESDALSEIYIKLTPETQDYDKIIKKYKSADSTDSYILKQDKEVPYELKLSIAKSLVAVESIEKVQKSGEEISFGEMKLPAGTNILKMLSNLPEQNRSQIIDKLGEKFSSMDDATLIQAGAKAVQTEYEKLGADMPSIQTMYILKTGGIMLLIALLSAACTVAVGFFASRTAAGLSRNLRKKVFEKVSKFSNAEFDKFSTASLITRTTNDITQIQMLVVMMMRMVIYAPILGVGGVIRAVSKSPSMSWIIGLAVVLLLGIIFMLFSVALPKFKLIQKYIDRLNLIVRENLSGLSVIFAFNNQKFEEKRFDLTNRELTATNLFVNRAMSILMPSMMIIMNGCTLLIIWVGAHQIANSTLMVGDMMAFMQYAMQIIMSFLMLSFMFIFIPRASVSAVRVAEVLESEATITDPVTALEFDKKIVGTVEFKNVSFKYPKAEEDVIKNVSFKALPGQTTAIIGSTGSGKSTLVNLIPRFYDVTDGEILFDGVDIRSVSMQDLRSKIGYVPQKASLFSGTIKSNLLYADENASDETINKAIKTAQASEIISESEEGLMREIAQGGANVSGGQKQRISIARALVKKPEVYIFDDSFSALDFKTDAALRKELKNYTSNATVLIVAQRINTIRNADQIIVLDNGDVVGLGTHKELMENCEVYREIALSQLSKEELA